MPWRKNAVLRQSNRHSFEERLLLFLSREPESGDYREAKDHWTPENALSQLCRVFPGFLDRVVDKEILDFGCGTGYQSVALAEVGAKHVVGLDVEPTNLEKARQLANQNGLAGKVTFLDRLNASFRARFDVVISQNSMEHFPQPIDVLREMKLVLKDDGVILITFGPPWFAPYGSHMHFFIRLPWVNVVFDEKTIMTVRSYFRKDGANRYEDVEGGLNKMTVRRFEKLTSTPDLQVEYQRYDCVKGLNFLGKLPLVRELFVNQISCVLSPVSFHSASK